VFARDPTLPLDASLLDSNDVLDFHDLREKALLLRATAIENIHKKQEKDKGIYDSKHREGEFEVGDRGNIFIPIRQVGKSQKLLLHWFGPYKITKKLSEVKQEKGKKTDVVHIGRILPFYDEFGGGGGGTITGAGLQGPLLRIWLKYKGKLYFGCIYYCLNTTKYALTNIHPAGKKPYQPQRLQR